MRVAALVLQTQTWPAAGETWQAFIEASGVQTAYVAEPTVVMEAVAQVLGQP